MKRFMLLRHALPDRHTFKGADKDRPLSATGIKQADVMGVLMRDQEFIPDYIACSSALRTRQTLEHLQFENIKTEFFDSLYLPKKKTIEDHIQFELPQDCDCALFIIHFPGVLDFTYSYDNRIHNFPECSLAAFECDIDSWEDFDSPKLARFISGNEL